MRIGEPLRALIVEVGERALFEFFGSVRVLRQDAVGVDMLGYLCFGVSLIPWDADSDSRTFLKFSLLQWVSENLRVEPTVIPHDRWYNMVVGGANGKETFGIMCVALLVCIRRLRAADMLSYGNCHGSASRPV